MSRAAEISAQQQINLSNSESESVDSEEESKIETKSQKKVASNTREEKKMGGKSKGKVEQRDTMMGAKFEKNSNRMEDSYSKMLDRSKLEPSILTSEASNAAPSSNNNRTHKNIDLNGSSSSSDEDAFHEEEKTIKGSSKIELNETESK